MIVSLRVKNICGYSYLLNFVNNRKEVSNKMTIDKKSLFPVMQFTGDNYEKVVAAFSLLKILNSERTLRAHCSELTSVSSIEINFLLYDSDEDGYLPQNYFIEYSDRGILTERVNGQSLVIKQPFISQVPYLVMEYFKMIFVVNLTDLSSTESIMNGFKKALELKPFAKNFLVPFLRSCGFDHIRDVYIQNEVIKVKSGKDTIESFNSTQRDLKLLCGISWIIYLSLLKTGTVVLHNVDRVFTPDIVNNLCYVVNNVEDFEMNNFQLVFTSSHPSSTLFPEQFVVNFYNKELDINCCTWQTF